MARDKCVLAYSGGMDSTISIVWIRENYDLDVVTLSVDIGAGPELEGIRERAASAGAVESLVWTLKTSSPATSSSPDSKPAQCTNPHTHSPPPSADP